MQTVSGLTTENTSETVLSIVESVETFYGDIVKYCAQKAHIMEPSKRCYQDEYNIRPILDLRLTPHSAHKCMLPFIPSHNMSFNTPKPLFLRYNILGPIHHFE